MISLLGVVSAGAAVGALAVAGHWLSHQRDSLGRPRGFPVWSVSLLALLAVVAAVPGIRRRAQERRLSKVATALVGHRVSVHCQSLGGALTDVGAELGFVKYGPNGPEPSTLIKREVCGELRHYAGGHQSHPSRDDVIAVHVLTHEAMHMRGLTGEAAAECAAVQRDRTTAELLGATEPEARELARIYWLTVYPDMPADYRLDTCHAGTSEDEHLASAPWMP